MKFKHLVLTTAAAAALAACSQDKVLEENTGNAIGFSGVLDKATRAQETNTNNLNNFYVSAFFVNSPNTQYLNNEEFRKNGTNFVSASSPKWPGSPLKFYAFSPSLSELSFNNNPVTVNWSQKKLIGFKPNPDIQAQKDFITADIQAESGTPQLRFDHRLSQIEILAKNNSPFYTYEVVGLRIGRAIGVANFNFADNTWDTGQSDKADYTFDYSSAPVRLSGVFQSVMGRSNSAMLIPQRLTAWDKSPSNVNKGAFLAVKIRISTPSGQFFPTSPNQYGWVAVPISTNWEAGKKYVYKLDFTQGAGKGAPGEPNAGKDILGGAIQFTVSVNNWSPEREQNLYMDGTPVAPASGNGH